MPWQEFTIDNCKNTIGDSLRKDKALIMQYKSQNLNIRITARFHDGHFKYYLDCEQANIYETWIGVPTVESRKSIKRIALYLIGNAIGRSNLTCLVDLKTAEAELEESQHESDPEDF